VRKIAHIVNPVVVGPASDLYWAQPITFETMRIARSFAAGRVEVELIATQYPEDAALVPDDFRRTPELERSVQDIGRFKLWRKYPLLRDVLDRLYQATDAEYLVFSNVDICVMPHFYLAVNALIDAGRQAFVINRRTISDRYKSVAEVPLMYGEVGAKHEGHDCFVFRRDAYPSYRVADVCIGIPYVGRALIWNLFLHAERFEELTDHHYTFHIGAGNERTLGEDDYQDYRSHNRGEAAKAKAALEAAGPPEKLKATFARYPLDFALVTPPPRRRRRLSLARLRSVLRG
jgi:hypothetical protein